MYYITQSTIITSPIGFNIGFTNVDTKLKQLCINVVSTLFQRRALTLYQRCTTLKIRRRILLHFQRRIDVISTLIHNVETKPIQRLNVGWEKTIKLLPYHSFYGGHISPQKNSKPQGLPFNSILKIFKLSWTLQHSTLNMCDYYFFLAEYKLVK